MNSAPPKIAPANIRVAGMVLAATLLGAAAFIYCFDPATHQIYPVCQFHRLTGLNCPGCGMTRAAYALLHGNLSTAFRDNALLVAGLGWLAGRGVWFGWNRLRGKANAPFFPVKYLWPLLVVAILFTALRNFSAFAFLSP